MQQGSETSAISISSQCGPLSRAVAFPGSTMLDTDPRQNPCRPLHMHAAVFLPPTSDVSLATASNASSHRSTLKVSATGSLLAQGRLHRPYGQCRQSIIGPQCRQHTSPAPQASLASFDTAIPVKTSNSMTAQLQPRAYSASHTLGRHAQADQTDSLHGMTSIEAVR